MSNQTRTGEAVIGVPEVLAVEAMGRAAPAEVAEALLGTRNHPDFEGLSGALQDEFFDAHFPVVLGRGMPDNPALVTDFDEALAALGSSRGVA